MLCFYWSGQGKGGRGLFLKLFAQVQVHAFDSFRTVKSLFFSISVFFSLTQLIHPCLFNWLSFKWVDSTWCLDLQCCVGGWMDGLGCLSFNWFPSFSIVLKFIFIVFLGTSLCLPLSLPSFHIFIIGCKHRATISWQRFRSASCVQQYKLAYNSLKF